MCYSLLVLDFKLRLMYMFVKFFKCTANNFLKTWYISLFPLYAARCHAEGRDKVEPVM